jgi:hypothetical protein
MNVGAAAGRPARPPTDAFCMSFRLTEVGRATIGSVTGERRTPEVLGLLVEGQRLRTATAAAEGLRRY